jgi:hypothetical protein
MIWSGKISFLSGYFWFLTSVALFHLRTSGFIDFVWNCLSFRQVKTFGIWFFFEGWSSSDVLI